MGYMHNFNKGHRPVIQRTTWGISPLFFSGGSPYWKTKMTAAYRGGNISRELYIVYQRIFYTFYSDFASSFYNSCKKSWFYTNSRILCRLIWAFFIIKMHGCGFWLCFDDALYLSVRKIGLIWVQNVLSVQTFGHNMV